MKQTKCNNRTMEAVNNVFGLHLNEAILYARTFTIFRSENVVI